VAERVVEANGERVVEANGVEHCTERFGVRGDPPLLLVMGVGASMLWWDEGFCRLLAEGGRFVIRYDHRDTGRSVTYEPCRPQYTGADLLADGAYGHCRLWRVTAELRPGGRALRLTRYAGPSARSAKRGPQPIGSDHRDPPAAQSAFFCRRCRLVRG
jgi:hypothetical protein